MTRKYVNQWLRDGRWIILAELSDNITSTEYKEITNKLSYMQ